MDEVICDGNVWPLQGFSLRETYLHDRLNTVIEAAATDHASGGRAAHSNGNTSGWSPEERLSFALTAGRLGSWELDLKTRQLLTTDIYKANWGRPPTEDFSYDTLLVSIHPDDRQRHEQAVAAAVASGSSLDIDYRSVWPDGSIHWLRVRGRAVYDQGGTPTRMAGISLDITDQKRVEESLREQTRTLEILNRTGAELAGDLDLERIVQAVTDAGTELSGAQFGAFFYNVLDDKGERYMLYTISGVPREAFSRFPMPRNTAVFEPTFRGTGIVRSDDIRKDRRYGKTAPHFGQPKGHLPVVSYLAVPVISRSGEVLGGLFFGHEKPGVFTERSEKIVAGIAAQAAIAIDNANLFRASQTELTERRRIEQQQSLLLAELNHRVKNTLAIVQSIATQTLRHADTTEAFRAGFEARLMALAEAHNLLTDSNWGGASLKDIVERVLVPYAAPDDERYALPDDDVRVGPKAAVSLVMAFHELATNAAKYGALSNDTGSLRVEWKEITGSDPPRLFVKWQESGGPEVGPPRRQGFGSRLIRGLAQESSGEVRLDFARSGLTCTIDIPLYGEH
jgi:two-component sensor histidine kinase